MFHKILNIVVVSSKGMKIPRRIPGLLLSALFASSCSNGKAKNSTPAPPVIVGLSIKKTVPVEIRAVGNGRAYEFLKTYPPDGGIERLHRGIHENQ